jgi:hypothetical protein
MRETHREDALYPRTLNKLVLPLLFCKVRKVRQRAQAAMIFNTRSGSALLFSLFLVHLDSIRLNTFKCP